MNEKKIKVVLGNNPDVAPIKNGDLKLSGAEIEFVEFKETHDAFKPMVREQAFDFCEMAIVTLILAKAYGRPLHMLPAVMIGRLQQPFASVNGNVQMSSPADIAGKRIGVRSYTQTTVTWLRGILKSDYGADMAAAQWISFEDGHVPEADDPSERAPAGRKMNEMLFAGDLDCALGLRSDDPRVKPLFPEPEKAAQEWYDRHKCIPVNHIIAVTEDMVANHLDLVSEFYGSLKKAKSMAGPTVSGPDTKPIGFEAIRPSVELLIRYTDELGMLPRRMTMDDLIDPRIREAVGE